MQLKTISKNHFTIASGDAIYDIQLNFNYPEQCRDERWFVHEKSNDGWDMLESFDTECLSDAITYVSKLCKA